MRPLTFVPAAFAVMIAGLATPAAAYIGPGVGAGAIAVVLGVIGAIAMAFVAILWYPIKRLIRGKKAPAKAEGRADDDGEA
ncbi:MAG: hypothetical protein ACFBSD_03570 [Paracoccaceae bacterium]